jgi:anti-anti-sigma factor
MVRREEKRMSANQDLRRWEGAARSPKFGSGMGSQDRRPAVRVRTVDGLTVVDVLDAENLFAAEAIAELAAQLHRPVEAGHTRMLLNFRGVRSMSSDVLGTLAGLHRRLEKLGGRLGLSDPDPGLRDMLRICRLDRLFEIVAEGAEASGTTQDRVVPALLNHPPSPARCEGQGA